MTRKKILIIEDNPVNMQLVSDLLEVAGFEILEADSAETGLELAREVRPDLILMDVALPGMDGLTSTRRLKEDDQTATIPVVALTAYAMFGDEEKAKEAGCVGYITKPIDTREFPGLVAAFLEKEGQW